jgi:hypothetical protein
MLGRALPLARQLLLSPSAQQALAACVVCDTRPACAGVAAAAGASCAPSAHFATNSHDIFNIHRAAPNNNEQTHFDFTEANYAHAAEIISRYPPNYKASAVIPLLDLAQQQNQGWLPLAALNRVAKASCRVQGIDDDGSLSLPDIT